MPPFTSINRQPSPQNESVNPAHLLKQPPKPFSAASLGKHRKRVRNNNDDENEDSSSTTSGNLPRGSRKRVRQNFDVVAELHDDEDEDYTAEDAAADAAVNGSVDYARAPARERRRRENELTIEERLVRPTSDHDSRKLTRDEKIRLLNTRDDITKMLKEYEYGRVHVDRDNPEVVPQAEEKLRRTVQNASFSTITTEHIDKLRLPLERVVQRGPAWKVPVDIILDARSYLRRLKRNELDPDPLRGIEKTHKRSQKLKADGSLTNKIEQRTSYAIEEGYKARYAIVAGQAGENGLVNGDWWPLQLCAVRDGAHRDTEAGISGNASEGATSVIVSGGQKIPVLKYDDIDEGDVVEYCGTRGKANERGTPGTPSENTQLMLKAQANRTPVRLMRSAKAKDKSKYAPSVGLRYDGLYLITKHEILDVANAFYRFTLKRKEGQPPIRWEGPGSKPTWKERMWWNTHQQEWSSKEI